jgi:putative tryptophan/tyrosine transport system substrate-binding protein
VTSATLLLRCAAAVGLSFALFVPSAEAQREGKTYRIGFLSPYSEETAKSWRAAFGRGLQELGYTEGRNVIVVERYAAARAELLPAMAAELARLPADVVVTHGDRAVLVAQKADAKIPVVFAVSADPVGSGLVNNLARPGGNVTGFSDLHSGLVAKRLQILKQLLPSATRIAVLHDGAQKTALLQLPEVEAAAAALGVTILPMGVKGAKDLARVFDAVKQARPEGMMVLGGPLMGTHEREIAAFTLHNRLPASYTLRHMVEAGVLMSYGADFNDLYRRSAGYVDRILKGTKAGNLPVEQPTKFELVINTRTANAFGLAIPPALLLQADHLIE